MYMKYTIHRSFSTLADLSSEWNLLLAESITNVPFLRYEYLSTWWGRRGGGEWPESAELLVLTAEKDGKLAGIAPLIRVEEEACLMLLGSIEISDYLDLIVRPEEAEAFLHGLLDHLVTAPLTWKSLDWHNLLETSPIPGLLQAEAERRGWSFNREQTYHAPAIPLPGDFEAYLAGIDKKQRHEIRRKMRRAEEQGGVEWYLVQDKEKLESEMTAFLEMMAGDPAKAAFLTDEMRAQMQDSARAAFEAGWLQLAFLTVNGQKTAGYLNFDYQGRVWVYNSGLDRRFMEYSPGWVLLAYLLRWANEQGRSEFDFMRGDEEYKYRFGGVDRHLVRVKVTRSDPN